MFLWGNKLWKAIHKLLWMGDRDMYDLDESEKTFLEPTSHVPEVSEEWGNKLWKAIQGEKLDVTPSHESLV